MALVYQSLCYEADTLFLLLTKLTQKEIRYKVEIERFMNDGFVHIAKARYIMGNSCVTKLQLPTEKSSSVKSLVTVSRAMLNNHWIFHISRKKVKNSDEIIQEEEEKVVENGHVGSKASLKKTTSLTKSENSFQNLLQNDIKALKKTKNVYCVDDDLYNYYHEEFLDEMSTTSNDSVSSITNPIRLFGVLVPNALKEAQKMFKNVVDLLGKCATLQAELVTVLDRYSHLIMVKELIESAAFEMSLNITEPKVYWTSSEASTITHHTVTPEPVEPDEAELNLMDKKKSKSVMRANLMKSVVSVFYDRKNVEEEESEMSIWGSQSSEDDD